jgi:hypothetical protein
VFSSPKYNASQTNAWPIETSSKNGIHFLGVGGNGEKVDFLLLKPMKNRYSYQIISHP